MEKTDAFEPSTATAQTLFLREDSVSQYPEEPSLSKTVGTLSAKAATQQHLPFQSSTIHFSVSPNEQKQSTNRTMTLFKEHCLLSYSRQDIYSRYLRLNLPNVPFDFKSSQFGQLLKDLGINAFPFSICPADLIYHQVLQPSLYVEFPQEHFEQWERFPKLGSRGVIPHLDVSLEPRYFPLRHITDINDFLHPYDTDLKDTFAKKFSSQIPTQPPLKNHPNGRPYISAEAYIPYWQAYALASIFHKVRHLSFFLSHNPGKSQCLDWMKNQVFQFIEKFGNTFERLSWYRTVTAHGQFFNHQYSPREHLALSHYRSSSNSDNLKQDMQLLLSLHHSWEQQIKEHGCLVLQNTTTHLTQDIYYLYEQLRLLGFSATQLFEEYQSESRTKSASNLHQVLNMEYYDFRKTFTLFGDSYSKAGEWGYSINEHTFEQLFQVQGFDSWVRSFYDLHQELNDKMRPKATFKLSRILDKLLVMSVRTEIVLREMLRPTLGSQSDEPLPQLLKRIKELTPAPILKEVLGEYCRHVKKDKSLTKLNQKPENLFQNIDAISVPCSNPDGKEKTCSEEKTYFLRSILKFITARNYFAHHSYKDDELDIKTSLLSKEILESLISTILFFNRHSPSF